MTNWSVRSTLILRIGGGLLALLNTFPLYAQVTYFDRPPSANEILGALQSGKGTDSSAPANKARGVAIGGGASSPASGPRDAAGRACAADQDEPAVALPVRFNAGSAKASASSSPYLHAIATVLTVAPSLHMVIEGHTDALGDQRSNLMLSWERAFSVFRILVDDYGIDPARLRPVGKGATEPLPGKAAKDGINRRVQFRLVN